MSSKDLGPNLGLLCSHGRSTSAICRQAPINRHQLQRYLNGQPRPRCTRWVGFAISSGWKNMRYCYDAGFRGPCQWAPAAAGAQLRPDFGV